MKDNTQYFFTGLFIGIVIVVGIFAFFQPPTEITQEEKMKECIVAGGQYSVSDYSFKDDGSDYRMTCEIPKRRLWQFKI
jgi:hypothetical protein